ncbi:MAG: helix-turn-helix transcriptional regulator [Mycobacteriaceae bacterium]|nr:helix-turn-helix transcriptional regulator [Mycobacteriaceae bacterium]
MPGIAARLERYRAGVPVYRYVPGPAGPPVSVLRFTPALLGSERGSPHIHDFPVLAYLEGDGGVFTAGGVERRFRAGDVVVVAAGAVVGAEASALIAGRTVGIFFAPEAVAGAWSGLPQSWRSHPLLFPFVHGLPGGLLRLHVPAADREFWTATIAALEAELAESRDGYREAALAHLTLLLVAVARLASDVVGDLRRSDESLLAEVFEVIEKGYRKPLSLRSVSAAVSLTPGYLTTVVRRKTGRTVQDWIADRRMAEARKLLAETDRPVSDIARAVGYRDPAYFTRTFRRVHGAAPRAWRRNDP